ncbi:MAG: hypothetical protein ACYS8X_07380 [Planctomycetota bacterium]|jgi:hypothetical protein
MPVTNQSAGGGDLKERLLAELGRDKKKTFILVTLLVVGLVVGVRVMKKDPDPESALAGPPLGGMVAGDPSGSGAGPLPPPPTDEKDETYYEYIKSISHDIRRDLFRFRKDHFIPVVVNVPDPDLPVDIDSDTPIEAAPEIDWEKVITKQSRKFALESTIDSAAPIAVINGRMLSVGASLDGFRVVEITSGQCVVEKRGIHVTLKMAE